MPDIKLTYFNIRARAEPARLILAQAGVKYQDERLPNYWEEPEPWARLKPEVPFGQLPVLRYGDATVSQSTTINRFLAREFGLMGATSLEAALVDEVVDTVQGLLEADYAVFHEKDEARSARMAERYHEETVPRTLGLLEKRLAGRGGDYFVGGGLTLADIMYFYYWSEYKDREATRRYPKLSQLASRVESLPNIKTWLENRPKTKW